MYATAVPAVEIIDSKSNPEITFVKVSDDCYVPVFKKELKDIDTIVKKVLNQCDDQVNDKELDKLP